MVWPCGPYRSHDIPGIQPVFLIPGLVMTVTVRHGLLMALIEIDGLPNFIAWCWFSMANWQCHNQMVSPVTFWHKKNSPHLFFHAYTYTILYPSSHLWKMVCLQMMRSSSSQSVPEAAHFRVDLRSPARSCGFGDHVAIGSAQLRIRPPLGCT